MKLAIFIFLFILTSSANATNYCNDANIVLCAKMNVDEDPIQDSSSLNHDGTLDSAGNPDYSTDSPLGYSDGSYDFANDKISFGDHADFSPHAGASGVMSIVAWVNFTTVSTTTNQRKFIIAKGDAGQYEYAMNSNGNGSDAVFSARVWQSGGTDVATLDSSRTITTGTWYHVAMTFDQVSDRGYLYVNGILEDESTLPSTSSDGTAALQLGKRQDNPSATDIDGNITQVAIFSRVLSQTEIIDIMENGLDGSEAGLVKTSVLAASADTMIRVDNPTTNYGTSATMASSTGTGDDAWLYKFDMSSIPVTTADKVVFRVYQNTRGNQHNMSLYRLVRDWTEGTATWNTTDGSTSWGTVGALNSSTDYTTTDSLTVANANGWFIGWDVTDITNTMLTTSNYGYIFRATLGLAYDTYSGKESASDDPYLYINYTDAPPADTVYTHTLNGNFTMGSGTIN